MDNGNWQIELLKDSADIVARTTHKLSFEEMQSFGFDKAQIALDILSIKNIFSSTLENPARSNIGVYNSNEKSSLYYYELLNFPIGVSADVRQTDADGNEVLPPQRPEPIWQESFRYYRLSQSSTDLFEAYRNLFLAFEAILSTICSKDKNEKESAWLKRSLDMVDKKVPLSNFAPVGEKSPVEFIIDSQYKKIRCNLQHAKHPSAKLPHSQLDPMDVQSAYGKLIKIWQQIASVYFSVPTDGGLMTYSAFESMMANVFGKGVLVSYTSDKSPAQNEDTKISPMDELVHNYDSTEYLGKIRPGVVRVKAHEDVVSNSANYSSPIHRICCSEPTMLISVAYIEQGINVNGVDEWKYIQDFKLINSSQPNAEFKT